MNERMPALFLGHGNPMNALERNRYTEAWRALRRLGAAAAGDPRHLRPLVLGATAVTAMPEPRTIHDFYGFPQALFDVQYPAPGSRTLAERDRRAGRSRRGSGSTTTAGASTTAPGRCSSTPSPTPTCRSSSCRSTRGKPLDEHLELAPRLAPLRDEGVLVLGSGNVVHNLGRLDWHRPDGG